MLKKYSRFLALSFALLLVLFPVLSAVPASAAENTVRGVWVFNETIDPFFTDSGGNRGVSVSFVCDSVSYDRIFFSAQDSFSYYVGDNASVDVFNFTLNAWTSSVFRTVDFGSDPQIVPSEFYSWLIDNAVYSAGNASWLSEVLGIFSAIGVWIPVIVLSLTSMFFLNGELTFVGCLAVAGLAFAVILLLLYLVSGFLRFRG